MKLIFYSVAALFFAVFLFAISGNENNWKVKIAPDDEPGERILVTGTAYDSDGKTPAKNINIYVYHTDNKGEYDNQRLSGTMITNENGKYEFNTIKPASYPDSKIPAHVHYKVWGNGYPEQWFELKFEGDKYLSQTEINKEKEKGNFASIQKTVKNNSGILECRYDLKLKR